MCVGIAPAGLCIIGIARVGAPFVALQTVVAAKATFLVCPGQANASVGVEARDRTGASICATLFVSP